MQIVSLLFYYHITSTLEKLTSYDKCSHNLTIEVQTFWKISANFIDRGFQKFQLKWKILKHFARPKQWAVFRKLFSIPSDKNLLRLWNKSFFTKIYRYIVFWVLNGFTKNFLWTYVINLVNKINSELKLVTFLLHMFQSIYS